MAGFHALIGIGEALITTAILVGGPGGPVRFDPLLEIAQLEQENAGAVFGGWGILGAATCLRRIYERETAPCIALPDFNFISGRISTADPVGPLVADFADTQDPGKLTLQVIPVFRHSKQGEFDQDGKIRYLPSGDRDTSFDLPVIPYLRNYQGSGNFRRDAFHLQLEKPVRSIRPGWRDRGYGPQNEIPFIRRRGRGLDTLPSPRLAGSVSRPGNMKTCHPEKMGVGATGSGAYMLHSGGQCGKMD